MWPSGSVKAAVRIPHSRPKRTVQQFDPARRQLRADRVRVLNPDRQLKPPRGIGVADGRRRDQLVRRRHAEQVHGHVLELEHDRVRVLVDRPRAKDIFVERLRPLRVVDEHRDRRNPLERFAHCLNIP